MSKQRAARRAVREAQEQRVRDARARAVARRNRRRAVVRRLTPRLPDRRVGKLFPRRTRTQRILIALAFAAGVAAVWYSFDDLTTRIALTATLVVVLPAIVVIAFGRR